jgi:Zn-finger nucleic acid-binding protein
MTPEEDAFGPYRAPAERPADEEPADVRPPEPKGDAGPCPVCGVAMFWVQHEGVAVEHCPQCKGHFVTHRAMEKLVLGRPRRRDARAGYAPPPGDPTREVLCAACGDVMKLGFFGPGCTVQVDVCAYHGTWFDHLDLELALDAVSAGTTWRRPDVAVKAAFARRAVVARPPPAPPPPPRTAAPAPFPYEDVVVAARKLLSAARSRDPAAIESALEALDALTGRVPRER